MAKISWTNLSITRQIGLLFFLPICGALVSVGVFYAFLARTGTDAHFVDTAGRQGLLAEQLQAYAYMVHTGQEEDREGLRQLVDRFDQALSLLEGGGIARDGGLFSPQEIAEELARVRQLWSELKPSFLLIAARPVGDPEAESAYAFVVSDNRLLIETADQVVAEFIGVNRRLRQRMLLFLGVIAGMDVVLLLFSIRVMRNYLAERQRLEERMHTAVEGSHEGFIAMDTDGRIVDWNGQATATFGWSCEQARGQLLGELIIPPPYREAHREGLKRFLATGKGPLLNKRVEMTALHRDGHEFPVEWTVTPLLWGDSCVFTAFLHDITERKRAEEVLHINLALQRLRNQILLMEREDDWLKVVDVFQHELQSLVDCHGTSINLVDPQGGGGIFYYHWEGQTRTVTTAEMPLAVRTALDTAAPLYRRTRADIDRIEPELRPEVRSVVDVPFGQAGTVAANSLKERAFSDDDLQVLQQFAAAAAEGVRRLRDLRALAQREQELAQARHQELVGQLAAGVAHEINNPLTSVIGYAQLLLRRDLPAAERGFAETILAEGRRAHAIAERLLAFARACSGDWVTARLADLADSVVQLVRFQYEAEGVAIHTELAGDLPARPLQPAAIQQLLLALLDNSRRALHRGALRRSARPGGSIQVSAWQDDGRLCLAVEDDGPGVPEEIRDRVFDPFFGTDLAGGEAGLGLSLALRIAIDHGGHLRCEPVPCGARFVLDLPVETALPGVGPAVVDVQPARAPA